MSSTTWLLLLFLVVTTTANFRVDLSKRDSELKDITSIKYREDVINTVLNGSNPNAIVINDFDEFVRLNANIRVGLTNFRELQYYGPLYLGSHRQKMHFVYDTGSSWLWFPKKTCAGCPTKNGYDFKASSTYNETSQVIDLYYGKGHVSGHIAYDLVALMSLEVKSVSVKMLAVEGAEDLEGTQADGILGLSPEPKSGADSLVKRLAQDGVIDGAEFTVFLGAVDESSYVDFGKYKGNTDNVTWIPLTDTNYWRVKLNSMSYKKDPINLETTRAVLDTGSSIIGFPRTDLKNIIFAVKEDRQLFYLEDINFYGVRWRSVNEFYDIIVNIGGHHSRISSNDYMIKVNEYCIFFLFDLGANMNFILLGDSYLKGNIIIHDVDNKQVGLFPQMLYYPPRDYQETNVVVYLVLLVALILILGWLCVFIYHSFCRNKKVIEDDEEEGYELMRDQNN